MKDIEKDIERAATADEEELTALVYHPSPKVIANVARNKNLTESLVVIIAGRRNIPHEILESLANNKKWKNSYKVRLALCKNPKTPQKVSFALIGSLKIFDLGDLTRNAVIPIALRMRIEEDIREKIPAIPLGIKITLAKKVSSNVLIGFIQEGMKQVASVCLDSPYMTEDVIYKIISMEKISPQVIRMIANHPKWSFRYKIRWALISNNNAPLASVVNFLKDMKTTDLKELYAAPEVPSLTKPYIYRELLEREEIEAKI